MNYSIIDSVKGGSGKTCFSLMHSLYLYILETDIETKAEVKKHCDDCTKTKKNKNCPTTPACNEPKEIEEKIKRRNPALYIDMDFVGTSLESILFGGKVLNSNTLKESFSEADPLLGKKTDKGVFFIEEYPSQPCAAKRYFNAIFDTEAYGDLISKLKFELAIPMTTPLQLKDYYLDMIISSPEYKDKLMFRGTKNTEINISNFKYKLHSLLKEVPKNKNEKYKNIVIDMPPGAERFASSVYEIFVRRSGDPTCKIKLDEKKDKLNIFHMTTHDKSHIDSTIENISHFYTGGIHTEILDCLNIFVVINDIFNASKNPKSADFSHAPSYNAEFALPADIMETFLGSFASLPNNIIDNIYFILFPHNLEYKAAALSDKENNRGLSNVYLQEDCINTVYGRTSTGSLIHKYTNISKVLSASDVKKLFETKS